MRCSACRFQVKVKHGRTRRFSFHSLLFHRKDTPSASHTRCVSTARLLGVLWRRHRTRRKSDGRTGAGGSRGIIVSSTKPILSHVTKKKDGEDENTKYVFVEPYQDQPLQLGEGQAMGWFSPDDTHELKMIEHDRAIVERMREYLNQL